MEKVDEVFDEAVRRGIVLRGMDTHWETDLTGMSFPVARAACRFMIRRAKRTAETNLDGLETIIFITGVGASQQRRQVSVSNRASSSQLQGNQKIDLNSITLREYVQEVLNTDFDPPIESDIPELAQGTVEVKKKSFRKWLKTQKQG